VLLLGEIEPGRAGFNRGLRGGHRPVDGGQQGWPWWVAVLVHACAATRGLRGASRASSSPRSDCRRSWSRLAGYLGLSGLLIYLNQRDPGASATAVSSGWLNSNGPQRHRGRRAISAAGSWIVTIVPGGGCRGGPPVHAGPPPARQRAWSPPGQCPSHC